MSHRVVSALLLLAGGAVLVLAYLLPTRVGHPVTPLMESAADGAAGRKVTTLPAGGDRPRVIVFVLPGCPCSIEYEPYVQRLHRAYGDQAEFIEVVAGDPGAAEQWKQQHAAPFPVLSDADGKIAREFGALRSAYTALVLNGKVAKLWPGYSSETLGELGRLISTETNVPVRPIDTNGAPEKLISGCSL
ncbi:membrane protein : Peroxiredoxin OS=Singulisphaera acidiphila (strain ATCC BAA-1392 / DSM 18658 / VKM B-2454 / MOB10) GN=Sinac_1684 PE=4 SV=1: AhpC-TSA [Gemmata massiliana]|uniref:Thioredoxin domain-containing protein n=1 Tax=Gemmata massiliana TaxID=1210884 RepID=A0A6P2DBE4_9BACT|nr:redoxin domain-containing protein [Gemmata massiliana]VTR98295.1 membrane protein : Peroxiredoxin OS=Singulisphaera acidiphila (strain ATCC BAA-1392 / DSM 18658 / VKM B-2454 / MOB10) GN=Sinac_1684 PE=4 SV=1: AhpC-TSA [Gemmata massiliana]